jgi:hypothetical protein
MLGAVKDVTGTYGTGLLLLSAIFLAGAVALLQLGSVWSRRWQPHAAKQAGIFCYRGVVKEILGSETA